MKNNNITAQIAILLLSFGISNTVYGMGLRSFVALPVEKDGAVVRLAFEHAKKSDIDSITTSMAYGLSANQTVLLGLPYRLSPAGKDRQGDVSVLYRHIAWKNDSFMGTDRLGILAGLIVPTENDRDAAVQAGFVFTHFKNRNEIDVDILYQSGIDNRLDSGRYDLSWQYRLSPVDRPDWGFASELNTVVELNGRWNEGNSVSHQLTLGLQWIHPKVVIEGGMVNDLNNANETRFILSTRFHF